MCHVSVLNNVARRFKEISEKSDEKYFVRISAGSPLIDYRIIKKMLKNFKINMYFIQIEEKISLRSNCKKF